MARISVAKKLGRAFEDPGSAMALLRLYATPFGLGRFKDPEAKRLGRLCWGDLPRRQPREVFPGIDKVGVRVFRTFDRVIGTNVSPLELLILTSTARLIEARNLVEIGTFNGNTTLNLVANAADDARIHTVTLAEREQGDVQYRDTPYEDRVEQVYCDSTKLDWGSMKPPFDFIFIDGAHEYAFVKKDTENALATVADGGVVFWHDYGSRLDVSRAVDEIPASSGLELSAFVGTQLAVGIKR